MCGRYVIDKERDIDLWQAVYDAVGGPEAAGRLSGEVRPGDTAPVICRTRSRKPTAFLMEWGWRMDDGRRLINIRSETAGAKAAFRDSFRLHRCAVPASYYFEWERRGQEKIKYAIEPASGEPLFMAGLYRMEGDRAAFAILTREPAREIAFIHDRMPVALPVDQARLWINPETDPEALLRQLQPDMRFRQADDGPEQLRMEMPEGI